MTKETKFELRNVEDLIPYARNARTHSPEQIQRIAGSIKEFGFLNPVVISNDGGILAGHGRVMAAQKLGLKEVPCVIESHLTEAQKRAYILADNRLALDAGWDEEMLKVELTDLRDEFNFDLDLIGFNQEELESFFENNPIEMESESGEDEEVEIDENAEAVTNPGDIWLLGDHRLMCCDSRDEECVNKLFSSNKPILMVTDPPYGVKYDASSRVTYKDKEHKELKMSASKKRIGVVLNDEITHWYDSYKLFPGNVAYVWLASTHADDFMTDLKECGFEISSVIVWNKPQLVFGHCDYHWKHELCLYATKGNHNWKGDRKQSTVWDIETIRTLKKEEGEWGHSTQKPIECMKRPIENNSETGDYVYDPFCGSGTTIIAAQRTGRKCLACELNPVYCDAIVKRWEHETGERAIREGDGLAFDDLIA